MKYGFTIDNSRKNLGDIWFTHRNPHVAHRLP
jgi:hypothetical protein